MTLVSKTTRVGTFDIVYDIASNFKYLLDGFNLKLAAYSFD